MRDAQHLQVLLRSSEARAQTILNASLDAIVLMDHEGRFLDYNPAAEAVFGYKRAELIGRPIADFIIPERLREAHRNGMAHYLATGFGPVVNKRVDLPALRADGSEFPIELAIVPIEGEPHSVFVGFVRDVSARKAAEERQAFLLEELTHRSKNLLTVVQAIVNRTLKDHPPDTARPVLLERLGALARSHTALGAHTPGASLARIVAEEVAGFSSRVQIEGADLSLKASVAQTLALIIHELATNATKHGSLAASGGRVDIRWSVSQEHQPTFSFEWRESGGPIVTPPTRAGFGRTVLEQIAAAEFKSAPAIDFAPEGMSYRLQAPLSSTIETA